MEDNKKLDHQELPESIDKSSGADFMGHDGEDIIELTEIVNKAELEAFRTSTQSPPIADDEDEIIELTDIVAPQIPYADAMAAVPEPALDDEDDIIELIDIVEPRVPDAVAITAAAEPAIDDEDEIIELIDIVEPRIPDEVAMAAATEPAMDDGDKIIELFDIVEPGTAEEEAMPATESAVSDAQKVLGSTDQEAQEISGQLPDSSAYFEKQHQSIEDTLSELESMMDETFSGEEGIIELDDVLNDRGEPDTAFDTPDDQVLEEVPADSGANDYDAFPIGIAIDEEMDDETPDQQPPSLTNEQIDAAVERLILAKYGQSIEQFIATSIEKIVTKQIESLRKSLLEDDGPID
jgi:hypothetical protein